MLNPTVFIVGAGASTDFGLPLGSDLALRIRGTLTGQHADALSPIMASAMRSDLAGDFGAAARDLAGGMNTARSVDRFLDSRKDRPLVQAIGKRAIAFEIAMSEANSDLGRDRDFENWPQAQEAMINCNQSWIARLFSLLNEGISPARARDVFENIVFVTFNYDRVIETYLALAFQIAMNQPINDARDIVRDIPIEHVYGSLGSLPGSNGPQPIPFGTMPHLANWILDKSAQTIRTFTEQKDTNTLARIHAWIFHAKLIVFLGFGFDKLNVDMLFPSSLRDDQRYIGTSIGLGLVDQTNFEQRIGCPGALTPQPCANLIQSPEFRTALGI